LAGLKEITAQIVGIISSGWQIPAGNAHMALTSQVTDLVVCNVTVGLPKILAWEALGDHSLDLPVAVPPSVGPIPVDLPSPPIVTDSAAGSSTNTTTKSWAMVKDKGKGKADLEPEVDRSRKRKSPMISALPSQPLKSAMKGRKRVRSACIAKSRMVVESGDDEDPVIQVFGVLYFMIVPNVFVSFPCSPQLILGLPDPLTHLGLPRNKPLAWFR
jgi:hypothetical protein